MVQTLMRMMMMMLKVNKPFTILKKLHHAGNYTLSHDFDEEIDDKKSVSASTSIKSIKSACDEEQRELQVKLMENYVNDQTKQKYKKSNSLKRIFTKKEKKEKSSK